MRLNDLEQQPILADYLIIGLLAPFFVAYLVGGLALQLVKFAIEFHQRKHDVLR